MLRFKSHGQAQRFLAVHAAVYNLFNFGPHLSAARHYRKLRQRALASWAHAGAA
jgi:putative transposase